jgi:hypothetical protein
MQKKGRPQTISDDQIRHWHAKYNGIWADIARNECESKDPDAQKRFAAKLRQRARSASLSLKSLSTVGTAQMTDGEILQMANDLLSDWDRSNPPTAGEAQYSPWARYARHIPWMLERRLVEFGYEARTAKLRIELLRSNGTLPKVPEVSSPTAQTVIQTHLEAWIHENVAQAEAFTKNMQLFEASSDNGLGFLGTDAVVVALDEMVTMLEKTGVRTPLNDLVESLRNYREAENTGIDSKTKAIEAGMAANKMLEIGAVNPGKRFNRRKKYNKK